jgi:hypothetical protein
MKGEEPRFLEKFAPTLACERTFKLLRHLVQLLKIRNPILVAQRKFTAL